MHTLITRGQAGPIASDREIHESAAAVPPRQRRRMGWVTNGDAYQASATICHEYVGFLNARGQRSVRGRPGAITDRIEVEVIGLPPNRQREGRGEWDQEKSADH